METLLPDVQCFANIPKLSYSLLSVSKTSVFGNTVKFSKTGFEIVNISEKILIVAFSTEVGNLFYFFEHCRKTENLRRAKNNSESQTG